MALREKKPSLLSSSVEINILQSARSLEILQHKTPHLFHFFLPTHDVVCRLFLPNGMTAKFCVCMIGKATLELEAFLLRCMTLKKMFLLLSKKRKSSELSPGKVGFIQYSAAMLEILSQSYFLTYRYLRRAFKK